MSAGETARSSMSEKDEPQSPPQQTADCNLTLLLNVSIIVRSVMVIYVGTHGSYASRSVPGSFSTNQKPPQSSEIQNTFTASSYSTQAPLQCDSRDRSIARGTERDQALNLKLQSTYSK